MKKILAVGLNTFRESVRQKIFFILLIFGFTLLLTSFFLYPLSVGEQSKIIRDFGASAISFFNILLIIIVGSTLIYKEIEKRTIYLVVTTPIEKSEIIIGKFLGLFLIIIINIVTMNIMHQVLIFFTDKKFDPTLFIIFYPFLFECSILISFLILFSTFSSSILSAIIGFLIYIIGHLIESLKLFAEISKIKIIKYISYFFYYILPNLENFNIKSNVVYGEIPSFNYFLFSSSYGIIYTIIILYIAIIVLEKKEFK
ncbi:MAG: ABC transporter permease subunit [candidate division WOR-3 bacterium]